MLPLVTRYEINKIGGGVKMSEKILKRIEAVNPQMAAAIREKLALGMSLSPEERRESIRAFRKTGPYAPPPQAPEMIYLWGPYRGL